MRKSPTLCALSIENLAIVDRTDLHFGPGLNVLSGETGAGKSILVDALLLLLGARATGELVRSGEEQGAVEALIDLGDSQLARERFERGGFDVAGGEVVIRRVVGRSGRGRVTINGQLATLAMLGQVTKGLIDISGQHEHVSLLDVDTHLDLVDAHGGLWPLRKDVALRFAELSQIRQALDELDTDEAEKARREDFLRFQLEEIAQVSPELGEVEALESERRMLQHATRLAEGTKRAEGLLYSEDGALTGVLGRVQLDLEQLSRLDDRLAPLAAAAQSALVELEELSRQLERYGRDLEADPGRLLEVDDRLEALRRLLRKHGGSVESVLAARDRMARELDLLENDEARRAELTERLAGAERAFCALAQKLSEQRVGAGRALAQAIESELRSLSMASTRIHLELRALERASARGSERAEILIAPNPGEPPRPLAKTASGGELSRVLLAVKRVLADRDSVATYVFDEVDSGIGGAVADVLGRKLHEVSSDHQVLCITHLAQVAAHADHHFRVHKTVEEGRTVSVVEALDDTQSVAELARMLGGIDITSKTLQLAQEMRGRAREIASTRAATRAAAKVLERAESLTSAGLAPEVESAPPSLAPKAAKKPREGKAGKGRPRAEGPSVRNRAGR